MSQFDNIIDRTGTSAIKLIECKALFGREDIVPMWVADMDVATAPQITKALAERAAHGIYGYTGESDADYAAIEGWLKNRFGVSIERDWIMWSANVVSAIRFAINALTREGDRVVIQTPVYTPFFMAVRDAGRELRRSPLINTDGYYTMDYDDLETAFRGGARAMVLCNPHNPVGRVWTRDEMTRLVELCRRYDVTLISDEIHAGFIYKGYTHNSVLNFDYENSIMLMSASKSFNLAGLGISNMIVRRKDWRERISAFTRRVGASDGSNNVFGSIAQRVAYTECGGWLDELTAYVEGNADETLRRIREEMPLIRCRRPEGTYLMWLDTRALAPADDVFRALCEAGVGLNRGDGYGEGKECTGYMRLNVACPRAQLDKALDCMVRAYGALTGK
jgi:cystathionine beta-lyase